uniref:Glucosylceramidase n=1 Tax=Timema cristinae TaxID=61476 RepID=A0A7R9CVM6_TIMCR|nr:unnamed protein product [Timema cristinae]
MKQLRPTSQDGLVGWVVKGCPGRGEIWVSITTLCLADNCVPRYYGYSSFVCVCNSTYCDTMDASPQRSLVGGSYRHFVSTKDGLRFDSTVANFTRKPKIYFSMKRAMTDASGINIASLSVNAQDNLLKSYFAPTGIEYTFIRVPIAGSDFSTREYSYDDVNGDISLVHFGLAEEDYQYKIPYIKKAQALSKRKLKLFSAPWGSPKWMKKDGFIKSDYYQLWADYFIRFLDEYKKQGLHFWGLSPENEPVTPSFLGIAYPFNFVMWTPEMMVKFIVEYLGPALSNNGYGDLLLMMLDDQRAFVPEWSEKLFTSELLKRFASGLAVHWYNDKMSNPDILTQFHDENPDMFILYTEACNGSWERAENYVSSIIEVLNHWVSGWVDWNLVLDLKGGPNWANNVVDSPIIVNATADEFYKQPMFYGLGHFSKFIRAGSGRIDLQYDDNGLQGLETVAAIAPDGVITIVVQNRQFNSDDSKGCPKEFLELDIYT